MNYHRIWGLVMRHLYNFRHNLDRLFDGFYWPAIDIIIWGLTFQYVEKTDVEISNVLLLMLSGLIFWQVVWRGQYEMTVNFLEEIWNKNLVNLFSSPLTVNEWMSGLVILSILKMLVTIGFSIMLAWILYSINIFSFGLLIIPFVVLLLMMGWWVGLFVAGLLSYLGQNLQIFAWAGVFILFPFSAIYYPVSTLPFWAQIIAKMLPSSYIFEGMREVVLSGNFNYGNLIVSLTLNIFYLILSILFFKFMFRKSKEKGLARLE